MCTEKNEWHLERGCESLCPLQGYNLALVRAAIHWVFGSGTGLWEDVCNRLEQFRYCFVVFEAAGVALRYRPVGLSESTRSSRHFKYSLELYLALWYWANASRSIRYAVESGCYDSIDLGSSLTSWRSMNLTEMVLDHPFRFLSLLRTSEMLVKPIWLLLASMWDTPALWGQCLRIFFDLWVFDLEIYFVIFISVAYSWRLVIAVSELL